MTLEAVAPTLSLLSRQLREAARTAEPVQRARTDFLSYLAYVARDQSGRPLRNDPYTRLMADVFQSCQASGRHLSHVAMPGLGKSTLARHYCLWDKGRRPETSTVVISAHMDISDKAVGLCRELIQLPAYRQVFPHVVLDNDQSGEFRGKTRGAERTCFFFRLPGERQSPDAAFESVAAIPDAEARRVDVLLADDVMTREVARSKARREHLISAFRETWIQGRLSNGGWCVALQNCWHTEDLAHLLLTDERFCSVWLGVTQTLDRLMVKIWNPPDTLQILSEPEAFEAEEARPQFRQTPPDVEYTLPLPESPPDKPDQYAPERFRMLLRSDPSGTRKMFWLQADSPEDKMFPNWINRTTHPGTVSEMLGVPEIGGRPVFTRQTDQMRFAFGGGMDISSEARPGDVIWFGCKDQQGKKYPIEIHRGNFTASHVCEVIQDAWERGIRFACFYVENVATQDKFLQEIRTVAKGRRYEWVHRVSGWQTGRNKFDPSMGLPTMDVEMENGGFVWPAGEARRRDVAHAQAWALAEADFAECPKFPRPGETPDTVMAAWFCDRALERATPSGGRTVMPVAFDRHGRQWGSIFARY